MEKLLLCVQQRMDLLKYSIIWWGNTIWEWMQSIMWVCEFVCAQYACFYVNVMYMSIVYVFWLNVVDIIASILPCVMTCVLCSVRMAGLLLCMHLIIINLNQWSVWWKNTKLMWISPTRYDVCCLLFSFIWAHLGSLFIDYVVLCEWTISKFDNNNTYSLLEYCVVIYIMLC